MYNLVTTKDKELFLSKNKETLAEWSCILNRWGWPEEIPDKEEVDMTVKGVGGRRSQLREYLEDKAGHRLTSFVWNKKIMTKEEHDDFYEGAFLGNTEARERSDQCLWSKLNDDE